MIEPHVEITFDDHGLKALFAKVQDAQKQALDVGPLDAPPDLVKIAKIHEFGAPEAHIPTRSYLRATMLEQKTRYGNMLKDLLTRWQAGELSLEQALYRLSTNVVGDVQKRITRGIEPALKPATVASKKRHGYARPQTALEATLRLFNSIKARIV